MECAFYKSQYVGKSETPFNLCLNNCRFDLFNRNTIPACCHFSQDKHRFNKYPKFTLIESLTNTTKPKETLQEL